MSTWTRWGEPHPAHAAAGLRFDHAPSGAIRAPVGKLRVCAYHVDFDERPTCYLDVDDLTAAKAAAAEVLRGNTGWNVDFATAFDEQGEVVGSNCPWAAVSF